MLVPGNHEYYRARPADADRLLARCARSVGNLHVLNPGVVAIDGTRFVGATLWFPPTRGEERYRPGVADFQLIAGFGPWVRDAHAAQLAYLESEVRPGDVVVTHHLPHPRSVASRYRGSDAARCVERAGAQLWVHGHTHVGCDYVAGVTRVVCNPRGYPGEGLHALEVARVVEVEV